MGRRRLLLAGLVFGLVCGLIVFGLAAAEKGMVKGVAYGFFVFVIAGGLWLILLPRFAGFFGAEVSDDSPRQSRSTRLSLLPEAAQERASRALRAMGATVKGRQQGEITATMPRTIKSFGERLTVTFEPAEDGTMVTIRSEPRVRTTIIDYGKGRENVERFLAELTPEP